MRKVSDSCGTAPIEKTRSAVMRDELRRSFKQHPKATVLFLSPPVVALATEIAEDIGCYAPYRLDPWLGLQHALVWLVIATAFCQLNREFCREVVGDDPPFGTEFFGLLFMSLNINGVLAIFLFVPYKFVHLFVPHTCN
jgi:hypothetical protein